MYIRRFGMKLFNYYVTHWVFRVVILINCLFIFIRFFIMKGHSMWWTFALDKGRTVSSIIKYIYRIPLWNNMFFFVVLSLNVFTFRMNACVYLPAKGIICSLSSVTRETFVSLLEPQCSPLTTWSPAVFNECFVPVNVWYSCMNFRFGTPCPWCWKTEDGWYHMDIL